ncbi:MAG: hypothetical protein KA314_01935 [Chloroflexi bacterium]|nr:hypothetical protein [Chloroflexota bacterium]MBP8054569.1 hypothetical protein [Chloroflexota bacterium]
MPNNLIISLASYRKPDNEFDIELSSDGGGWALFWKTIAGRGQADPGPKYYLAEIIDAIPANQVTLRVLILDLFSFLEQGNCYDLNDLKSLLDATTNNACVIITSWISIGNYWKIKHNKQLNEVLAKFGAPKFAPRNGINDTHGGFEPIKTEWDSIRRDDLPEDGCSEKNRYCREAVCKSLVLNAIVDDLQSCGATKLLNSVSRGGQLKNTEATDMLFDIGLLKRAKGKPYITAQILKVAIQERDFWWKLTHKHWRGIGRSFILWLNSLWKNDLLLIYVAWALLLLTYLGDSLVWMKAGDVGLHWLRILNISVLIAVLGINWQVVKLNPQFRTDSNNGFIKSSVPTVSFLLFFVCLVVLMLQVQITEFPNPRVKKISHDDWLFSADKAEILIYVERNFSCNASVETPENGGLAFNGCAIDKDGDILTCSLEAKGKQSGNPNVKISIFCGDETVETTLQIHRFMMPLAVREHSNLWLTFAALIPLAPALLKREYPFDLALKKPKELFCLGVCFLFIFFVFFGIPT